MRWHSEDYAAAWAKVSAWAESHSTVVLVIAAFLLALVIGKFFL